MLEWCDMNAQLHMKPGDCTNCMILFELSIMRRSVLDTIDVFSLFLIFRS